MAFPVVERWISVACGLTVSLLTFNAEERALSAKESLGGTGLSLCPSESMDHHTLIDLTLGSEPMPEEGPGPSLSIESN